MSPLNFPDRPTEGMTSWFTKRETYDDFVEDTLNDISDSAVTNEDPRLPIVVTRAAYNALTPVEGQIYIIRG